MGLRTRLGNIFRRKGKEATEATVAVAPPPPPPAPRPPPPAPPPKQAPKTVAKAEPKKEKAKEAIKSEESTLAPLQSVSEGIAPIQKALSSALEPMWTLEDRDDGFNDVRKAIKERQKPWEEFKASLDRAGQAPAIRWTKVLVDEAKDLASKK